MAKNGEAKMRFIKVAPAPCIGERITREIDGTETKTPFNYALQGFLEEYVWVDDRWSAGLDGDAEAWALAFDRLTDALAGDALVEGSEIPIEPDDWLKLRIVATTCSHMQNGVRVSGVDPRVARVVRKAHINSIVLARSGPAPKLAPAPTPDDDNEEEDAAHAPS